ncbi:MAG: cellulase family glycosylhydrolase [Nitrospirae bacterium]|nr:cellulase family glycosylhydrolase [Nitrospirota bacterium]
MICTKKMLYAAGIFSLLIVVCLVNPLYPKERISGGSENSAYSEMSQKREQMRRLIKQREEEGADLSEVMSVLEQSRIARQNGDKQESIRLLDKAITLLEKGGFTKQKQSVTAAAAQGSEIIVELPVGSSQVEVTELVPDAASGKDIGTHAPAFKSYNLTADNKKVRLKLGGVPLFVREITNQSSEKQTKPVTAGCKDSPFGIHDIDKFDERLADAGTCWVRHAGKTSLIWDMAEPERGKFDWSRTDEALNETHRSNIETIVNISTFNHWDQGRARGRGSKKLVKDIAAYQAFLQQAVRRYPFVKAWQIENEPDNKLFWPDTPENYLTLLKISYQAIKRANPEALVVIGGASHPTALDGRFWSEVFQLLEKQRSKERYFDVFDIHWFLHVDRYMQNMEQLTEYVRNAKGKLGKAGYQTVPVWITEMASYSGSPMELGPISEKQHAGELVKLYVHSLSQGVSKIFWVRLIEWSGFKGKTNGYFGNTGLINNPLNDGESHKKLAYYSYKKLAELFRGVNLKNIDISAPGGQAHAYKFVKDGNPVYFVW